MTVAGKLRKVAQLLEREHGPRPPARRRRDPLDELISTTLSQHTSDANSQRAFKALRRSLPTWEEVLAAPMPRLVEAIRSGGLANVKAPRIKAILAQIHREQGHFDLRFLRDLPDAEARAYLARFPGVGAKTIACVMLFALGKPAFPVDTHVHRVAKRLGLLDRVGTPEKAQATFERLVPPAQHYALHLQLIAHGRRVCRAQRPLCPQCGLRRLCDYARGAKGRGSGAGIGAPGRHAR
jgi:endonuclease-3